MGDYQLGEEQLFLSWHGMYTSFENDLDLEFGNGLADPISDQWEFVYRCGKNNRLSDWLVQIRSAGACLSFQFIR